MVGVKKNRNYGFTASASVLKLVKTIQKMGKKKIKATVQATTGHRMSLTFERLPITAIFIS